MENNTDAEDHQEIAVLEVEGAPHSAHAGGGAMAILTLSPNTPTEIALRFPDGKQVEGRFGDQIMYSLAQPAEHVMYLDLDVAAKLNVLEPRKGEVILACKRWTGKKGDKMQWDFWRPNTGETKPQADAGASARTPAPEPTAVGQSASTDNGHGSKPNGFANGHGSNGYTLGDAVPAHGSGPNNNSRVNPELPVPPSKIPIDQAAIASVRMMQFAMQATGEQWSDQARQDFATTLLITMQKEGWLCIYRPADLEVRR